MSWDSIEVDGVFIGARCNRIVNNVSWGACDLVAFGAQNGVAIFCPKTGRIVTTLPGHKALVNCTCWAPSAKDSFRAQTSGEYFLISGSADGDIIVWAIFLKELKWTYMLQVPKSHDKGVTCITALMLSEGACAIATAASDGFGFVWEMLLPSSVGGDCKLTCVDSISTGSRAMVALSLAELPKSPGHVILAMGGLDNKVHLYSGQRSGKLSFACALKGHTDWIRGLDFYLPSSPDEGIGFIFLVSSSQDKSICVWRIALHGSQGLNTHEGVSLMSYIEGPVFAVASFTCQVSLESLLVGHDDWVQLHGNLLFQCIMREKGGISLKAFCLHPWTKQ